MADPVQAPPTVTIQDIDAARRRIQQDPEWVSPCPESKSLSRLCGCTVFVKLENLQTTGSFKDRGALNRLTTLTPAERQAGVIAASAGNHAQAVAYHAGLQGIPARIVMPMGTPLTKVTATRGYGGDVVLHGSNYDDALEHARALGKAEGRTFVHGFDDPFVIAGQGTIGLELLEQTPRMQTVVVPIGGGGLISGIAVALKETNPKIRVVGVQTQALPSMKQSLGKGAPETLPAAMTIADGIAIKRPGALPFALVQRYVDEIVTVDDEEIAAAILLLLEREKTLAEGAGAAALAALYYRKLAVEGQRVVLIVSGGNIDMTTLDRIIERGLVQDGRLAQFSIRIQDSPGSLARLTALLGELRANILQINHSRAFRHVTLGETEVEVSLETRGREHVRELVRALEAQRYRVLVIAPREP